MPFTHVFFLFFMQLLSQVSEEGVPSMDLLLSSEIHTLEDTDPELFECVSDVLDGLLVDVREVIADIVSLSPPSIIEFGPYSRSHLTENLAYIFG